MMRLDRWDVTCHRLPDRAGAHVVFISRPEAAPAVVALLTQAGRPVLRQWPADGGVWLQLAPRYTQAGLFGEEGDA